eukprot:377843-Rhodomonas_salina.1
MVGGTTQAHCVRATARPLSIIESQAQPCLAAALNHDHDDDDDDHLIEDYAYYVFIPTLFHGSEGSYAVRYHAAPQA